MTVDAGAVRLWHDTGSVWEEANYIRPAQASIVNADVSASAAIAYSKLALTGSVVNADINASAGIVDTKLATIATAGKVSNSATTATAVNTNSAIVARDGSGNFAAGTITANLTGNVTGNASTATSATSATSAATLTTPRTIWGQSFNGSGNISGALTVTTGGITVTGNSTITGTLGGVSTFTAASVNISSSALSCTNTSAGMVMSATSVTNATNREVLRLTQSIGTSATMNVGGGAATQLAVTCAFSGTTVDAGVQASGIRITNLSLASGATVVDYAALYIAAQSGATNTYAIHSAGGNVRLEGLPVSSAGLATGTLWNNGGTLSVA